MSKAMSAFIFGLIIGGLTALGAIWVGIWMKL
jgi:hypothetical protein